MHKSNLRNVVFAAIVVMALGSSSRAQVPDYDFQWATITDANNPPYTGGPLGQLADKVGTGTTLRSEERQRLEYLFGLYEQLIAPLTAQPARRPRQPRRNANG